MPTVTENLYASMHRQHIHHDSVMSVINFSTSPRHHPSREDAIYGQLPEGDAEVLFPPPADLLFHGSFEQVLASLCFLPISLTVPQAKLVASSQHKFLLVNVQDYNEFRSHSLDRDVWNSPIIREIIQTFFIFFQVPSARRLISRPLNLFI